jgi:hypothetical protein
MCAVKNCYKWNTPEKVSKITCTQTLLKIGVHKSDRKQTVLSTFKNEQ